MEIDDDEAYRIALEISVFIEDSLPLLLKKYTAEDNLFRIDIIVAGISFALMTICDKYDDLKSLDKVEEACRVTRKLIEKRLKKKVAKKPSTKKIPEIVQVYTKERDESDYDALEISRELWNIIAEKKADNYLAFQSSMLLFRMIGLLTYGREVMIMYLKALQEDLEEDEDLDKQIEKCSKRLMKERTK